MKNLRHEIDLKAVKTIDAILVTVPFAACWFLYYMPLIIKEENFISQYLIIVLFFLVYIMYGKVYDGFLVSYNRISEMIYSQVLAFLITDGLAYIIICLMAGHLMWLVPGLLCIVGQVVVASIWSVIAHKWYFKYFPPKRTVIIYDMREGMENLINEYGMSKKFKVVETYKAEECVDDLKKKLRRVECVFLCGVHSHERNILLKYCVANNIRAYVIPRLGDSIMSGARAIHMFHLPMMWVGRYNPSPQFVIIKRMMDILISGVAILILSPVMLITAICIKSDGGPVLYKQVRLTKDGKKFKVLKFRSMRVDAEKDGVARLSTGDKDDRITPVGRFIRKVRIDELPQLFNILSGDMSIVGPRPERPEIAAQYEAVMPEFALRLQAKAGLTGLAQVYGQYNTTPYDKLNMDLMYIAQPNIMEDLRIIFATVKILFMPESTEGVDPGRVTALDYENEANRTEKWEKRDEHWAD